MARGFEVTAKQIEALQPPQMVELLRRLLLAEARVAGIGRAGVDVPGQITVADDGEDGSIRWSGGPEATEFLPGRYCVFQSKASKLPPARCEEEVRDSKGCLKSAIAECLSAGGDYLVFCSQPCNTRMLKARTKALKAAIRKVGKRAVSNKRVSFLDANRIAIWASARAPVAQWVIEEASGRRISQFKTWDRWGEDEDLATLKYVSSTESDEQLSQLRDHFSKPQAIARVVGLSGLGKTRLAFEAFRPSGSRLEPNRDADSVLVLYARADYSVDKIVEHAEELADDEVEATLVVDECAPELHHRLTEITRRVRSKLSLLTLDYDPNATASSECLVRVTPASEEVIKGILDQRCPGLASADISRIVAFAQGFPQIAVLVGRARLNNATDLGRLSHDELAERMIAGRKPISRRARDVIRACAMFEVLGVDNRVSEQMDFVARHLCGLDRRDFYAELQDFIARGLIQRRGDYIQVQPKPLALRLAAEKWKLIPPGDAVSLFSQELPLGLAESLCDQLAKLDFLPEVRSVAERLCESTGPFGRAEVLKTAVGSRCFRSIVEANPEAAVETLAREFSRRSATDLVEVTAARRNLVWSLEKLAFRASSFVQAMSVLLAFAEAENESWSNNATGEFVEKFQLHLSGTEAPPAAKFLVIDNALSSGNPRRVGIAVAALEKALTTEGFTRMGGAEAQGSGAALRDWQPKTDDEVREYYRSALSRLSRIGRSSSPSAPTARRAIVSHVRGLIRLGLLEDVREALTTAAPRGSPEWLEAIQGIMIFLEHDSGRTAEDYQVKVVALKDALMPQSLQERLHFYISELPWSIFVGESGDVSERERIACELAREVATDPQLLLGALPQLLQGEQRQIYAFGKELGRVFRDPPLLVSECLRVLPGISVSRANDSLLGSILCGVQPRDPGLVASTLDEIANSDSAIPDLIRMTTFIRITPRDLQRICQRLESGRQDPTKALVLAYGSVLDGLPSHEVGKLLKCLLDANSAGIALEIAMMYSHGKPGRLHELRDIVRSIVLNSGLFDRLQSSVGSDYHLEEAIRFLVTGEHGSAEVATFIANQLVRLNDAHAENLVGHFWDTVLPLLLKEHPEVVWTILSQALVGPRGYALESLLLRNSVSHQGPATLQSLPTELLLAWCRENPQQGPALVIRNSDVLDSDGSWSPIVLAILGEFGDQRAVRESLSVAIGSYSWTGSLVPYYEQYLQPLKSLEQHRRLRVREWARKQVRYIREQIAHEQKRDAERDFGIY